MEESVLDVSLWQRLNSNPAFHAVLFLCGLFLSVVEPLARYLSGKSISDSIWPYAYRTLIWTMNLMLNLFLKEVFSKRKYLE